MGGFFIIDVITVSLFGVRVWSVVWRKIIIVKWGLRGYWTIVKVD